MHSQNMTRILFAVVLLAASLAGCSSPAPAPVVPTVDQAPTVAAIQTQAVQTAVAALTLNAPTASPIVATSTTAPTSTTEPTNTAAPTNTPLPPLPTATATIRPWTATPADTATLTSSTCSITEVSPKSGDPLLPNADFDGRWVVKNTGSQTWSKDSTDIRYSSGTKFQKKVDALDLTTDVAKNDSYTIIVDMVAPGTPGTYQTTWNIVSGSQVVCGLYLTIKVSQ